MNPDQDITVHKLEARADMPVTHGVAPVRAAASAANAIAVARAKVITRDLRKAVNRGSEPAIRAKLVEAKVLEKNLVGTGVTMKDGSTAPGGSAEAAVKQDQKMTPEQAVGEWKHFYDDANEDVDDGESEQHKTTVEEDGTVSNVPDEIRTLAHEVDTDGDGKISMAEFLAAANRTGELPANMTQLEAKHVFEMVDDDDTGKLTVQQFGNAFEVNDDFRNHMNPDQDITVHKLEARAGMPVTHGVAAVRAVASAANAIAVARAKAITKDLRRDEAAHEMVATGVGSGDGDGDNAAERQVKADAQLTHTQKVAEWKHFFHEANQDVAAQTAG